MNLFKKSAAFMMSASMAVCSVPGIVYEMSANAEDALMTRDVWCANEDVNRWESEHFQFIWGKSGADSAKITPEFLEENARHLEACWDVYMNELSMEPPTQSVNFGLRDGNKYKVNFYISGTGLSPFQDDWAYMGYDSEGYAFMFCCVGSMQNSPNPSWVLPHEFGHVVTAHQIGWNDNKYVQAWWESIGNWYREQFLYSDYYQQWVSDPATATDYFETYMKNLHFTPILGRDNYASWAFLQYLTENPDNLKGYGSDFVKNLMQQGERDEYPYSEIERLSGANIKDTLGHYAKRMATLDLRKQECYRARQNELLARGAWNWNEIFTLPEYVPMNNYYVVPTERAPQQFGLNIIPLEVTDNEISINLEGLTDVKGADWRACIAVEQKDGKTRYSDLFSAGSGQTIEFDSAKDSAAYLTVTATPDMNSIVKCGVPWAYGEGEFDENNMPFMSKTRYPYAVTIYGAGIKQSEGAALPSGHYHANGGGFVADTATVADTAYVGKNAKVLGYAKVEGNAIITGHAVVAENATVKDNAIVGDTAGVMGRAVVKDNARVIESGLVYDDYVVSGNATVKGTAFCMAKGVSSGQAMPDGDYYDDSSRTVQAGSVYGWASPDKYVNSRPYNDGQLAGLEFNTDSSKIAQDTYTSTYGVVVGNPQWDAEKTSADGVITFGDDGDQYIIVDSSYAMVHDVEYQTAVLVRNSEGYTPIIKFNDYESSKYMTLGISGSDIMFDISDSEKNGNIVAKNAYNTGEWATISLSLVGDTASIIVNGEVVAEDTIKVDPIDVVSDNMSYLIGGNNSSMDFFRVNFKDVDEPEYYYTEKEDVKKSVMGDVNADGEFNIADAVAMSDWLLGKEKSLANWKAGDFISDGRLDVFDFCMMKNALIKK